MGILPFCEQKPLADLLEAAQTGTAANLGNWAVDLTPAIGRAPFHVNNQKIAWMLCPSSPLPQTEILRASTTPTCVVPSYVGISGATNHGGTNANVVATEIAFLETRLKPNQGIPSTPTANGQSAPSVGQQSWGGMLTPNESYGMAACIDGTSNTMLVSEKSDYFYSMHTGNNTGFRIRIDGSYTNAGTGTPTGGWWWLGLNNGYTSSQGPATSAFQVYNLTTLRAYTSPAPNNSVIGFNGKNTGLNAGNSATSTTVIQGIGQMSQNNPLISAHPNVVLSVFMDGHTAAITKNIPSAIIKRLATRDDGQQIGDY
jgi:hypothetical protein